MNMIVGYLLTFFGASGTVGSIMYIMNDRRYSYRVPFTSHETTFMTICIISFIVLITGIMTIIFSVIKNKNQAKLDSLTGTVGGAPIGNSCPNCGLNVSPNCTKCPKCNYDLKKSGGNYYGTNNN